MKTISIDGVIGWDVFAADVRQAIREAKGDDLTVEVNSPGGSVTEGIAIYNAIKNAPGSKTTLITGLAASMGSYIALAADRVTAEANAIYMIHNAGMIAMGDHNQLRKAADIAEGMSKILAAAYVRKTGKDAAEIAAMMDAETFLYGEEIQAAGFADEIVGQADGDKAEAVLRTRAAVASAEDLIKRLSTDQDTDQAAAVLAEYQPKTTAKAEPAGVASENTAAGPQIKGVKKMTEQEIAALKAEAYQDGIQAERRRVAGLTAWKGINSDADKAVEEAVASGKGYDEVAAQLAAAVAKGNSKQADGDNAPAVTSAVAKNAGNTTDETVDGMSAEDVRQLKAAGMTIEQIRANAPKGV
jgi:ATP-dependent protease ClpP protease subunit